MGSIFLVFNFQFSKNDNGIVEDIFNKQQTHLL